MSKIVSMDRVVQVRMPSQLEKAVKARARAKSMTFSEAVRRALVNAYADHTKGKTIRTRKSA